MTSLGWAAVALVVSLAGAGSAPHPGAPALRVACPEPACSGLVRLAHPVGLHPFENAGVLLLLFVRDRP